MVRIGRQPPLMIAPRVVVPAPSFASELPRLMIAWSLLEVERPERMVRTRASASSYRPQRQEARARGVLKTITSSGAGERAVSEAASDRSETMS